MKIEGLLSTTTKRFRAVVKVYRMGQTWVNHGRPLWVNPASPSPRPPPPHPWLDAKRLEARRRLVEINLRVREFHVRARADFKPRESLEVLPVAQALIRHGQKLQSHLLQVRQASQGRVHRRVGEPRQVAEIQAGDSRRRDVATHPRGTRLPAPQKITYTCEERTKKNKKTTE